MEETKIEGQSKVVLLLVLPYIAASTVLQARNWALAAAPVAIWAIGLSLLLGLIAWKLRSATPPAALTGALLNTSLMFSTFVYPYRPWQTAIVPVLVLLVMTSIVTRVGRKHKERFGTAEKRHGRGAAQVAANLGMAAVISEPAVHSAIADSARLHGGGGSVFVLGLAALAEAAADTVSSELGQVFGGQPWMITTFRRVAPGTDGGISVAGTVAGLVAAAVVVGAGELVLAQSVASLTIVWSGAVFGLFFDSLLGATLERRGWLNNDAVNFVSTGSAAVFALGLLMLFPNAR